MLLKDFVEKSLADIALGTSNTFPTKNNKTEYTCDPSHHDIHFDLLTDLKDDEIHVKDAWTAGQHCQSNVSRISFNLVLKLKENEPTEKSTD